MLITNLIARQLKVEQITHNYVPIFSYLQNQHMSGSNGFIVQHTSLFIISGNLVIFSIQ